ncbi:hypothetical protein [Halorarius halobius]|uniref:hypothetical protein n=1 Tax=Halorarius halobius TaxID=2962671 RepID=UPI0020CD9B87|nr:hypothetical protein [Halorarius halobius]
MSDDADSWLPYAGVGGVVACCLGLEVLGGAVVVGGLATTIGLSMGVTYLAVVGLGGLVALGLAAGYHHIGEANDGFLG